MNKKLEIYKCMECGNIVEILNPGGGAVSCCGEAMKLIKENTTDAAQEKHVPVIEKIDGGYKVAIGAVAHPMAEEHYIQWIELIADGKAYMQLLQPGDAAEAIFNIDAEQVCARAYCNLHGLWKA